MRPALVLATCLAIASSVAPVLADNDDHEEKAKFPMPANDFRQMVDAKTAKARAHMEECANTLSSTQAQAMRTNFDAGVTKINQEVDKATADGIVTKDEAKKVRETSKAVHGDMAKTCKNDKK